MQSLPKKNFTFLGFAGLCALRERFQVPQQQHARCTIGGLFEAYAQRGLGFNIRVADYVVAVDLDIHKICFPAEI